jgi:hypothetical protein
MLCVSCYSVRVGLQLANIIKIAEIRGTLTQATTLVIVLAMVLVPRVPWLLDYRKVFVRDSRHEMILAIRDRMPENARIVTDEAARLRTASQPVGSHQLFVEGAADPISRLWSLAELRDQGITHVVIYYDTYHRFLVDDTLAIGENAAVWKQTQPLYRRLRSNGSLIWRSEPRNPKPLHPRLEVYAMPTKL